MPQNFVEIQSTKYGLKNMVLNMYVCNTYKLKNMTCQQGRMMTDERRWMNVDGRKSMDERRWMKVDGRMSMDGNLWTEVCGWVSTTTRQTTDNK
jgi:hypothetical protein